MLLMIGFKEVQEPYRLDELIESYSARDEG
jgi:hypothetical protein